MLGGAADAPRKVSRFQAFLDNYVREQKQAGRFQRPLNNRLTHVDEWLQCNEVVENDNSVLVGIAFAFLAVCLLNTVGLLLAKFLTAPIAGVRRALGASRRQIFCQHLVEVGVIALAGGLLGLALGASSCCGLRRSTTDYDERGTRLDCVTIGPDGARSSRWSRESSRGLYPPGASAACSPPPT